MKKTIKVILCSIGVLILLVGIAFSMLIHSMKKSSEVKVDLALYSGIVQDRVGGAENYKFLPEEIPEDAVKAAFFHIPGFMQGADVIALRLALSSESIEALVEELSASDREEISSFDGYASGIGPYAYPSYGMKKPGSKNMFEGVYEIPDDFRIFLYKCNLKEIEENWNHHVLSFTAVSTDRNEVVYYITNG